MFYIFINFPKGYGKLHARLKSDCILAFNFIRFIFSDRSLTKSFFFNTYLSNEIISTDEYLF